jgi:hypothetical protein
MTPGEGYLLAGRFVQASVIQEKLLDQQMPLIRAHGLNREQGRLQIESRQGTGPWLICQDCIGVLGLSESDKTLAREAARRWWRDNSLPGHMPSQATPARTTTPIQAPGRPTTPSRAATSTTVRQQSTPLPASGGRPDSSRASDGTRRDHYQRVRGACEQSKEAAKVVTGAILTPGDHAAFEASELCQKVWRQALSGLSSERLDLTGADLSGMEFVECTLKGTCFRGAKLDRTIWFFARVQDADFSGASLRKCVTWGFFCEGAIFKGADVSGGRLQVVPSTTGGNPVDFSNANLADAVLSLGDAEGRIIFTNATMDGCELSFGPRATHRRRKAVLGSLSDVQRRVIKYKKWWEFWK